MNPDTDSFFTAVFHQRLGCGPIVTADDPTDDPGGFDTTILGPTPNMHQYGYCPVCRKPWRWSVRAQRWVDYDPAAVAKAAQELAVTQGVAWEEASEDTQRRYVLELVHLIVAFE
jgi:hypothetical protein